MSAPPSADSWLSCQPLPPKIQSPGGVSLAARGGKSRLGIRDRGVADSLGERHRELVDHASRHMQVWIGCRAGRG